METINQRSLATKARRHEVEFACVASNYNILLCDLVPLWLLFLPDNHMRMG